MRAPDRALDGVGVPAPAVGLRPVHVDGDGTGRTDRAVEEEAGCRDDDLVSRLEQRAHADAECVHGTVRDEDLGLGIDAAAGRPLELRSVGLSQRCKAARRGCRHGAADHPGDGLDHVVEGAPARASRGAAPVRRPQRGQPGAALSAS